MPGFAANTPVFFGASVEDESARIQSLRGLACLLLVGFHVVGVDSAAGLRFDDDSLPRLATNLLIHIRMPLFAFLSGFVYAYRPVGSGQELSFARKKLLRLFVPLLSVSTIFFLLQLVTPGVNAPVQLRDLWTIYVLPYQHFWFLQAIIIIFAATAILERLRLLGNIGVYLVVLLIAATLHNLAKFQPDIFSASQACYLGIFFWLGLGANRFRELVTKPSARRIVVSLFVVSYALFVYALVASMDHPTGRRTTLALVVSSSGVLAMLHVFPYSYWLARIGKYSFAIYLHHVFFTAGSRIALQAAGLQQYSAALFAICMLAGLAGPVAIYLIARRQAVLRQLLLGES